MKSISRKQFLQQSALGLGSVMLFSGFDFTSTKTDGDFVIGKTAFGKVRGKRERGVNIFKGIPYGGNVSGDYRFARPAQLEPWKGVKDTITLGTPAMQSPKTVYGIDEPQPDQRYYYSNWSALNFIFLRFAINPVKKSPFHSIALQ